MATADPIDVVASSGYKTADIAHPVQEVVFGVKIVNHNGNPPPVNDRRDANTKEVLKDYLPVS